MKRKFSLRKKIFGNLERPRISLFKSNKNIYVQIIDDNARVTLCSSSTLDRELSVRGRANKDTVVQVGELLVKRAKAKDITRVVFDRSGYRYHGVIKELADTCRRNGLEF